MRAPNAVRARRTPRHMREERASIVHHRSGWCSRAPASALAAKVETLRRRENNHKGQCRGCGHGVAGADFYARARGACGSDASGEKPHPVGQTDYVTTRVNGHIDTRRRAMERVQTLEPTALTAGGE